MMTSRPVRVLTLRGTACSELFRLHRFEKRRSLFLAKTLTPEPATPPVSLSQSLQSLSQEISLLHSEQSLLNTPGTSDILVQVTATSQSGLRKVSYYGTPFLVAELVSRFLMTGLTDAGTISPEKSFVDVTPRESSSPSLELLPNVTFVKSKTPRRSRRRTLPQGEA
jgi:hypothetical protein